MIDPYAVTDFNRNRGELEEYALFCVAAGMTPADYDLRQWSAGRDARKHNAQARASMTTVTLRI